MKIILLLFFTCTIGILHAQCLKGNCENGLGTYDYGYATYEGNFKNGKPDGKGTMDYGGGEKYIGNFSQGKEEGEGLLYKEGAAKKVIYKNGILQIKQEIVVAGGNKPLNNTGCTTGDCINGYGEATLASGNIFKGNFSNGKKNGEGTFFFVGGNKLTAYFIDNIPTRGTYYYAAQHTTFAGTLNEDGSPKSGTYESKSLDGKVEVIDGRIVAESHPERDSNKAAIAAANEEHDRNWKQCSQCQGKGYLKGYRESKDELTRWHDWEGNEYMTRKYTPGAAITSMCIYCWGKGEIKIKNKK